MSDLGELAEIRRSIRDAARQVEDLHLAELDRVDAGPGRMAAPKRLARDRFLGFRSKEAADWDWFYGLSRAEQARLRERWFSDDPQAQSPDEISERMDLRDWLAHTRRVDAARALASGRHVASHRHGGLDPNSLIEGTPYDVRRVWGDDDDALRHVHRAMRHHERRRKPPSDYASDGGRVAFRTRSDGAVYPIRATYELPKHDPNPNHRGADPMWDEPF